MVETMRAYAEADSAAPAIELFEDVRIVRDGELLAVQGEGRRALLALLAIHAGRIVPVERILDALWEDEPPASASKIVQTYISQLRRLLEPGEGDEWQTLLTRASGYVLALEHEATDVGAFEAAVAAAMHGEPGATFADALVRWRGEPYAGIAQTFARAEAARLDTLHREARKGWCAERIAEGSPQETLAELESLARDEPHDERVAALRMEALWRAGRRSTALQEFETLRESLAEELGLDPGPDLAALHLRMLREELPQSPTPDVPARPSPATRLPRERTALIGREAHVEGLTELVESEPLVTIVGPGGAGKTRVALRIAHALARDGAVWWVPLAGMSDPAALPIHVGRAIGMPQQYESDPGDALAAWFRDRPGLLVLDNCEHLSEPVAAFAEELLARCPELRVLATSRVPLHVYGEHKWRIPALDLPEEETAESLVASASGRLLLERAGRAGGALVPDAAEAAHLVRVCRRLDGMPLALELAAARLGGMSAADLDEGLDARFRLLTDGDLGGPSQHRTLRATTEWSYQLLSTQQRALLDRMSVFVGPIGLAAATSVCSGDGLDEDDVPAVLADLVDRSVVERERDRYTLLETVREFGRENLRDALTAWETRHGEWVAALVERVGQGVQGATAEWTSELESHLLDARAAFDRALARGDVRLAMRLAGRGNWALLSIGRLLLLRSWVTRSLEAADGVEVPAGLRGEVELLAGAVAGFSGDLDGADRGLARARAHFEETGEVAETLWVDYWSAAMEAERGRYAHAVEKGRRAADEAAGRGLGAIEANLRAGVAEVALVASFALEDDAAMSRVVDEETVRGLALCEGQRFDEAQLRLETNAALSRALVAPDREHLDECLALVERWRAFGRGLRLAVLLPAVASISLRCGRPDTSATLTVEVLEVLGFLGWEAPLPPALRVAAVLGHADAPEDCARLLGAAGSRWSTYRWRVPCDAAEAESALRVTLGDARCDELMVEGARQPLVSAVEAATRVARAAAGADC
ncbi:BTAD domain-containing putative transcriptional regulator [Demequina sp. NBRC 110054]|uniref:BTAD domain-containing putative transcriptional regulator n=1 Tax=Demequina sp. NBRC 110054 TaxID=1570343 RepID=UPI0009FC4AF1|nr:BTAD domain-containing putative transcriptional regulator [Demequina sp. NBRC 110054]